MNKKNTKIRDFWNYRSSSFDKSPGHTIRSAEEEKAWKSLFSHKLGDCHDILDVGSGTGFLSLMLADMGYHVIGIDISDKMLAKALTKACRKGYSIDFQIGDTEKLHFSDNSFDAIVNRAVLWSVPHPDVAAREWMRVLKPGGKLCFFLHSPHNSPMDTIQRNLINIWSLIAEKRNPWKVLDEKRAGVYLPFKGGVHPDVIISLLNKAGFADIIAEPLTEIDKLKKDHLPIMYRLGNRHVQYCYTARKPGCRF